MRVGCPGNGAHVDPRIGQAARAIRALGARHVRSSGGVLRWQEKPALPAPRLLRSDRQSHA
jgi:hypothetical protein